MKAGLKILSAAQFALLLYHINQLPYEEAQPLERELNEAYQECLEKWLELEVLAKRIRNKCTIEESNDAGNDVINELPEVLTGHSPLSLRKKLPGEPL